jgi:hypothetical protein
VGAIVSEGEGEGKLCYFIYFYWPSIMHILSVALDRYQVYLFNWNLLSYFDPNSLILTIYLLEILLK